MAELPIVVLAFANEQEGRRYRRDLPEELRQLQDILRETERQRLCRLELLPNATLEQILDVFTRNRDRVAVFHYAGHADSGRLLLEAAAGGGAAAHAAGLARFLGRCGGLQLVFLNGCSTRAQIARLIDGKIVAAGYVSPDRVGGGVLWDVEAGQLLIEPLRAGGGIVSVVAFTPHRETLAIGCGDRVELWDVALDSWRRRARQIANRSLTKDEWHQYFPDEDYRATFPDLPEGYGLPQTPQTQQPKVSSAASPSPAASQRPQLRGR
jgi:hypothetical protein